MVDRKYRAVAGVPDQAGRRDRSPRVAALRAVLERADPAPRLGRSRPARFPINHLEQLRDRGRGSGGAARIDLAVVDRTADLRGDRGRDLFGPVGLEVHRTTGSVAVEPVADVEVLLEVVA